MFILSKFYEMHPVAIDDFVYVSDNSCSGNEIIEMEHTILITLEYEIVTPNLYSFLGEFAKSVGFEKNKGYYMSMYLQEVAILHFEHYEFLPSHMTAASVYLAHKLLYPNDSYDWLPR